MNDDEPASSRHVVHKSLFRGRIPRLFRLSIPAVGMADGKAEQGGGSKEYVAAAFH